MKHRVPSEAEVKLWQESNRFTRKVGIEEERECKVVESFSEALNNSFPRQRVSKREAKSGPSGLSPAAHVGSDSGPNGPTPTLPLSGRELAPISHLPVREAARFFKSYSAIEAVLDLHGLNKLEAYSRVHGFITKHYRTGQRHLLIITGKGRIGPGLLRSELPHWLNESALRPMISAFAHAKPEKGGTGVTHVILKQHCD